MALLELRDVTKTFGGRTRPVHALRGVDLDLDTARTLALVGESGSGKSTLGRVVAGLHGATSGTATFGGYDLLGSWDRERRRSVQMVFQHPYQSLDPRWTVDRILREPLARLSGVRGAAPSARVAELLDLVGLPDVGWLTTTQWAKPTLALLFLWKTTGFIVVILLSGLQSIDGAVYEAASIDGASPVRRFLSITVPLVRRTLMFSVVLQTLAVFQMFAEPFVVTDGGPYGSTTTAGLHLYDHINRADLGTGAANSFLLVIIVMALSLGFVRLLRSED
jgi:ABC-type proline/glycine betaine transport system permease subunit